MRILSLLWVWIGLTACTQPPSERITSVQGPIAADSLGIALVHEHILVDFIGADSIRPGRYHRDSVIEKALPHLLALRKKGCRSLFECTPAYLGRDPLLLRELSIRSGLHIVTNTGYYGAAGQRFLPAHVFTETAEQLAARWVTEFENGIDNTDIKPGFMKLGADTGPLTEAQRKIMMAGALAHKQTGMTVAVHLGDGRAAQEVLSILRSQGVAPEAFVWVHAQNEKSLSVHQEMASAGAWVEFDSVNPESIEQYVGFLTFMKQQNLLHRTLLSHDAGWYHVGESGGGNYRGYLALFDSLLPRLRQEGFTQNELDLVLIKNPAQAFALRVRTNGH